MQASGMSSGLMFKAAGHAEPLNYGGACSKNVLALQLQVEGRVSYNGQSLDSFTPQRASCYVDQYDTHLSQVRHMATSQDIPSKHEHFLSKANRGDST